MGEQKKFKALLESAAIVSRGGVDKAGPQRAPLWFEVPRLPDLGSSA